MKIDNSTACIINNIIRTYNVIIYILINRESMSDILVKKNIILQVSISLVNILTCISIVILANNNDILDNIIHLLSL